MRQTNRLRLSTLPRCQAGFPPKSLLFTGVQCHFCSKCPCFPSFAAHHDRLLGPLAEADADTRPIGTGTPEKTLDPPWRFSATSTHAFAGYAGSFFDMFLFFVKRGHETVVSPTGVSALQRHDWCRTVPTGDVGGQSHAVLDTRRAEVSFGLRLLGSRHVNISTLGMMLFKSGRSPLFFPRVTQGCGSRCSSGATPVGHWWVRMLKRIFLQAMHFENYTMYM